MNSALPTRVMRRLRMPLLLAAVTIGFFWKLTLTRQFEWTAGPDIAGQVLPWFQVQAREWHAGHFPLWDPYLWAGQPLLGQIQPGAAYPLNWLLCLLPLKDGHLSVTALNWYFVFIHIMGAWFCYLLCRDLGRSRGGSVAAGLIFSLSGFMGSLVWPQMLNGVVWVPLVFLYLLRAANGGSRLGNAALSGMFLGFAWLSGHHQVPMYTVLASAAAWTCVIVRTKQKVRMAAAALASYGIMALVGALQILPAIEYGRLARRWAGAPEPLEWGQAVPYSVHAHYGISPFSLFATVFPGVFHHFDPFVGVAALALAFMALAIGWRDWRLRLFGAIGLGAMVYALGDHSVFQGALYALAPGLDKARTPSAIVFLFQLAVAVLAAFGVDRLCATPPSPWVRRAALAALSFGALTLAICQAVMFANKLEFPADDRVVLTGFVAVAMAALLYLCWRGALTHTQAGVLVALALLLEFGSYGQNLAVDRLDKGSMELLESLRANADIAAFLRAQPGFQRAEVSDDAFHENWGAWHGVEMHGGYLTGVTINVLDSEFHSLEGRRLYGVGWVIAKRPPSDTGEEVFAGSSGYKVYRRADAFPRAWSVHELVQVRDRGAGNAALATAWRDKAYLMEQPPRVETCGGTDQVELVEHAAGRLAIRADMACAGMVVLSDTFYPGWRARVDNAPVSILEVDGAMRGVLVPRGSHAITMRYRPASVIAGAALSICGVLSAALLAAFSRAAGNVRRPEV
jgi:hypothetical protein